MQTLTPHSINEMCYPATHELCVCVCVWTDLHVFAEFLRERHSNITNQEIVELRDFTIFLTVDTIFDWASKMPTATIFRAFDICCCFCHVPNISKTEAIVFKNRCNAYKVLLLARFPNMTLSEIITYMKLQN